MRRDASVGEEGAAPRGGAARPVRLGVVGLGYWGPNYARVISELPAAQLAWVCDKSPAALDSLRARYPHVPATTEIDDLLSDASLDAVVVASPTSSHFPLAISAIEAGKHVLCEKPLAQSVSECDELIDAAEAAGRVLMVGHTFIFNPAVRRMRALVESGRIGRLLYCHAARTGLGPIRQDVNALWDLGPHDVSIILYLAGRAPVAVSADGEAYLRSGTQDVVFLNLRLEGGVFANVHLSWLDPYKVRKVTVIGDERMVVFDDISPDEKLKLFDKGATYDAPAQEARGADYGEYTAIVRDGDIVIPKIPASEPLKEQMVHFLHCCQYDLTPETDGAAGRRVVAVLEAAAESLAGGGAPIELAGGRV